MKKFALFTLVVAQLLTAAQPAAAANPAQARTHETGVFAGFRLRVPLDGDEARPVRAGLALAPTVQSRSLSGGEVRTRFGEGLELGLRGSEPLRLSLAGTPVSQLVEGRRAPEGERAGVSTIGWVAIGVGALVTIVLVAGTLCLQDNDCIGSE